MTIPQTASLAGIVYMNKLALCMPYPQYYNLDTAMTGLDTVLTLIIPSVAVIILNIRIIIKIVRVERQRRPFVRQVGTFDVLLNTVLHRAFRSSFYVTELH